MSKPTTQPASAPRITLHSGLDASAVVSALQSGQTDLDSVLTFVETTALATAVWFPLVQRFDDLTKERLTERQIGFAVNSAVTAAVAAIPKQTKDLTCKVSRKGLLSVYGLNTRFPVSMYVNQWQRIAADLFGVAEFADTPIGKFADTAQPVVFSVDDYESKEDVAWLAEVRNGKHKHAQINGNTVKVRLSTEK